MTHDIETAARQVIEQSEQIIAMAYSYGANAGQAITPFRNALNDLKDALDAKQKMESISRCQLCGDQLSNRWYGDYCAGCAETLSK